MQVSLVETIEIDCAVRALADRAIGDRSQPADLAQCRRDLFGAHAKDLERTAFNEAVVDRDRRNFGRDRVVVHVSLDAFDRESERFSADWRTIAVAADASPAACSSCTGRPKRRATVEPRFFSNSRGSNSVRSVGCTRPAA